MCSPFTLLTSIISGDLPTSRIVVGLVVVVVAGSLVVVIVGVVVALKIKVTMGGSQGDWFPSLLLHRNIVFDQLNIIL